MKRSKKKYDFNEMKSEEAKTIETVDILEKKVADLEILLDNVSATEELKTLNNKQQDFCMRYVGLIGNTQGNATRSYMMAYDCLEDSARRQASYIIQNKTIADRINELFHMRFDDKNVDTETSKLIFQDYDLTNKVQAIKEYNKLKGRILSKVEVGYDESTKNFLDKIRAEPLD